MLDLTGSSQTSPPSLGPEDHARSSTHYVNGARPPLSAIPAWHEHPVTTWTVRSRFLIRVQHRFYYAFLSYILAVVLLGAVGLYYCENAEARSPPSNRKPDEHLLTFVDALFYSFSCVTQAGLSVTDWPRANRVTHVLSVILMFLGSMPLLALVPPLLRRYNFRKQHRTWRKAQRVREEEARRSIAQGVDGAVAAPLTSPAVAARNVPRELLPDNRSAPIDPAHVTENALFDEEASLEYRALGVVINVTVLYSFVWLLGGFVLLWFLAKQSAELPDDESSASVVWYATASAFNNNGLTLSENSFVDYPRPFLICAGLLVLAGNTMFPVLLRWILVLLLVFARRRGRSAQARERTAPTPTAAGQQEQGSADAQQEANSALIATCPPTAAANASVPGAEASDPRTPQELHERRTSTGSATYAAHSFPTTASPYFYDDAPAIAFLLENPRRVFTHLFPAPHTNWLFLTVLGLNGACASSVFLLDREYDWWQCVFQALATRTAGFTCLQLGDLSMATNFLLLVCMYVAASPTVVVMRGTRIGRRTKGSGRKNSRSRNYRTMGIASAFSQDQVVQERAASGTLHLPRAGGAAISQRQFDPEDDEPASLPDSTAAPTSTTTASEAAAIGDPTTTAEERQNASQSSSSSSSEERSACSSDEAPASPVHVDITGRPEGVEDEDEERNSISAQARHYLGKDIFALTVLTFAILAAEHGRFRNVTETLVGVSLSVSGIGAELPSTAPPERGLFLLGGRGRRRDPSKILPIMDVTTAGGDDVGSVINAPKSGADAEFRVGEGQVPVSSAAASNGHHDHDNYGRPPPPEIIPGDTYSLNTFFKVFYEIVSAYGTVGLSLGGGSSENLARGCSFSGSWRDASKILLCLVMLLGKLRGLPESIDPSVGATSMLGRRAPKTDANWRDLESEADAVAGDGRSRSPQVVPRSPTASDGATSRETADKGAKRG